MKKKLIAALLAGTMTCSLVLAGCAKEASREAGDPGQEEGGGKPAGEGQADAGQPMKQPRGLTPSMCRRGQRIRMNNAHRQRQHGMP